MPRVKKSVYSRARRNKWLGMAKGFRSGRRRLYRSAREGVEKALTFAYRDRKVRKREFRALWIVRINAALRPLGLSYRSLSAGSKRPKSTWTGRSWRTWPFSIPRGSPRWPTSPVRRCKSGFRLVAQASCRCAFWARMEL